MEEKGGRGRKKKSVIEYSLSSIIFFFLFLDFRKRRWEDGGKKGEGSFVQNVEYILSFP